MGKSSKKTTNKTSNKEKKSVDNSVNKRNKENKQQNKRSHKKSYETFEEKKFVSILAESGLTIHYMDGDGNCMFRSISDQLTGDPARHYEFRALIVDYIDKHSSHFKLFIEDDENIEDYVLRMACQFEWGGHQELYAASQCLNVNIIVHQLDTPNYILLAADAKSNKGDIHLSYHGECHYNSVHVNNDCRLPTSTCKDTKLVQEVPLYSSNDIEVVARSVPWVKDIRHIESALQQMNGDVNDAIEYLSSDSESLELELSAEITELTADLSKTKININNIEQHLSDSNILTYASNIRAVIATDPYDNVEQNCQSKSIHIRTNSADTMPQLISSTNNTALPEAVVRTENICVNTFNKLVTPKLYYNVIGGDGDSIVATDINLNNLQHTAGINEQSNAFSPNYISKDEDRSLSVEVNREGSNITDRSRTTVYSEDVNTTNKNHQNQHQTNEASVNSITADSKPFLEEVNKNEDGKVVNKEQKPSFHLTGTTGRNVNTNTNNKNNKAKLSTNQQSENFKQIDNERRIKPLSKKYIENIVGKAQTRPRSIKTTNF